MMGQQKSIKKFVLLAELLYFCSHALFRRTDFYRGGRIMDYHRYTE
jgi:hypothetical protein